MTKDVSKVESKPTLPALDASVMAAIQESVKVAVKDAVTVIVQQLKPSTLPSSPAPSIPVPNAGAPRPYVPPASASYKSKLEGIPVQEGEDLRHVNPAVINQWFNKVESRWKENFNKRKMDGQAVNVSWTRG